MLDVVVEDLGELLVDDLAKLDELIETGFFALEDADNLDVVLVTVTVFREIRVLVVILLMVDRQEDVEKHLEVDTCLADDVCFVEDWNDVCLVDAWVDVLDREDPDLLDVFELIVVEILVEEVDR